MAVTRPVTGSHKETCKRARSVQWPFKSRFVALVFRREIRYRGLEVILLGNFVAPRTVFVGMRYYAIHLGSDAKLAGNPALVGKWFGWWFLVWIVAYAFIYALQLPAKGILDNAWVRSIGVAIVVMAASWLILAVNGGPTASNPHLAISIGGGLGLLMLLNTWGVVWRAQKRLIAWSRASAEQGTPMPPETERLMRWNYLTARTSFWLSFPMLFFMAAASHYPFLSTVAR